MKRDQLWNLIEFFIESSKWKSEGYKGLSGEYKSCRINGSFKSWSPSYTSWLAFLDSSQQVTDGIFIAIYINRKHPYEDDFDLQNLELCYGISERKTPLMTWGNNTISKCKDNSVSKSYPRSLCFKRFGAEEITGNLENIKNQILDAVDEMIDDYKSLLDTEKNNAIVEETVETHLETIKKQPSSEPATIVPDEEQLALFNYIENSKNNIFIQGKAGVGKSFFINYLKNNTKKNICLLAPTAIAAINIAGSTLHSFFKLPLEDIFDVDEIKPTKHVCGLLRAVDVIVIDEISMVRPDMMDIIDKFAKKARDNSQPFGGIQMVLVGDLCQLPPVIKQNDIFYRKYNHLYPFFFDAPAYKNGDFKIYQMKTVHRQTDKTFLKYLETIRTASDNTSLADVANFFNKCKITDKKLLATSVTMTPTRNQAASINETRLRDIRKPAKIYMASIEGKFNLQENFPADERLELKEGALVMFNQNNKPLWINGSTGIVTGMGNKEITVKILSPANFTTCGSEVKVQRATWEQKAYEVDENNKIQSKTVASFTQFPLQLGYARTIHKMQGVTLDNAIIDITTGAFAAGQLYVALSRVRQKGGLHIIGQIKEKDIITDIRIIQFLSDDKLNLTLSTLKKLS